VQSQQCWLLERKTVLRLSPALENPSLRSQLTVKEPQMPDEETPDNDEVLDPEDKRLFLKEWDLKEGEMSDDEILMAMALGHF
jgi:hypothetical protein